MDVSAVAPFTNVECPECGKHTRVKREFGPYTLVRRHAIGGMSMVFAAHDNTLDREVALKILSEDFSADERRIAAFEEEARITASFSHPNVVRVLTTGRAFGRFYIAMEFVPGGHFEHQIRERGKIPEAEMLQIAIEVAQGLKAAHAAGLIHRDVKPGNILLDAEGHAKLVDFGLALVTQGGKAQATELWATPYYVPPETVEGKPEDFRSDIYAFGATLYHALAGKPSCGEESMATDILREAKKKIVPLSAVEPSISVDTCRIVEHAMAYESSARFSSYDELIANLAVALSHLKSGRSESTGTNSKRRADKKRRERLLILAGSLGILAAAGLGIWFLNRPQPAPAAPKIPPVANQAPAPVTAPAATDTAVEIAKSYREAREAVAAGDYEKALNGFSTLHHNPQVQEPTRSWAGIEAVLAAFLNGKSGDAQKIATEVVQHLRSLPEGSAPADAAMIGTLEKLRTLRPLPPAAPSAEHPFAVIATMLAGLKNWEQGMPLQAAACFEKVTTAKLTPEAKWAAIYQKIAGSYLADHALLSGPLFTTQPATKAGCEAAVDELNTILSTLKTRGRARFNVRAWQLDLTRTAKLMEAATANPATATPDSQDPPQPDPPETSPTLLADVLARLNELAKDRRFEEITSYLRSLPTDPDGATRASLLGITESSAVFLSDLEDDLAKGPVTADFQLKSGEKMTKIATDTSGAILVTSAADGHSRPVQWSDFPSDALIAIHRVLVKNPKSELERLRRHECAIAFEWLAGNRQRALDAAANLCQASPTFKQRWEIISSGLPK
jgi:serine/threonine protein kinase